MKQYILGQTEHYDATKMRVWAFKQVSDIIEGIHCNLSNMAGGYPFEMGGRKWNNSEVAYLCGEFSDGTGIDIQRELIGTKSGYAAKRFIKAKYLDRVRPDFKEFRLQWMLYVVWSKCVTNEDFRKKLLSIPDDVTLVEDTTTDTGGSAEIWGCKNYEHQRVKNAVAEETRQRLEGTMSKKALEAVIGVECCKVQNVGTWVGQNNIGKILMMCREAIKENAEPAIDRALLESKHIIILDKELEFSES